MAHELLHPLHREKRGSRVENTRGTTKQFRNLSTWTNRLVEVNRELWLLLSLFVIAGLLNWLVTSHEVLLTLYTLPTLFSAYVYGRRHSVMTAVASILLVVGTLWMTPGLLTRSTLSSTTDRWMDVIVWGGVLAVTAYAMGTLYEKKERHFRELRRPYFGVLAILQQFISDDKYARSHCLRVAVYASAIATRM